jgi:hypothetical protein
MEKAEGERKGLEYSAAADGGDLMVVGPAVQPVPEEPGAHGFMVQFKLGGDAADIHEGFPEQLRQWARRYDVEPAVTLMVIVPALFPIQPPRVRVVAPLLVHGSTRDFINGVPILPSLMNDGWNATTELITIMQHCRERLLFGDAAIAMDAPGCGMFPLQAAAATTARLQARRAPGIDHRRPFARKFFAYSARFVLESLHLEVPEGLEMGNKVRRCRGGDHTHVDIPPPPPHHPPSPAQILLSTVVLASMMAARAPLDLDEHAPISAIYPTAMRRAASHDENVLTEGGAAVFEMTSYTGVPAYVGVREFTAPLPDMAIVPTQVMLEMGITDGAEVDLRRVQLPNVVVRAAGERTGGGGRVSRRAH